MSCGDSDTCRRAVDAAAMAASALTGGTIGAFVAPKHPAVGAISGAMISGAFVGWFMSSYFGQPERPPIQSGQVSAQMRFP